MRKPIVKRGQMKQFRDVISTVFDDGETKGQRARQAKQYFAEVIIGSL
jgi:hypothetical protein